VGLGRENNCDEGVPNRYTDHWTSIYISSVDKGFRIGSSLELEMFCHQSLDQSIPSIRLIRVSNKLSSHGLLQHDIVHTSRHEALTGNSSSALPENPFRIILIDGRYFRIRENLFEFLCMARRDGFQDAATFDLSLPIWIDAICLDQSNPQERNHQVAQIGSIYSRAFSVQVCLGIVPDCKLSKLKANRAIYGKVKPAETIFREQVSCLTALYSHEPSWSVNASFDKLFSGLVDRNPYWERAWIVQEIFLAAGLTFWLHTIPVDQQLIAKIAKYVQRSRPAGSEWHTHFDDYNFSSGERVTNSSLVALLHRFSDKQRANPMDRIYSLLSLSQAIDIIEVDYQMPHSQLVYRVLDRYSPPSCLCVVLSVVKALQPRTKTQYKVSPRRHEEPWVEFDLPSCNFEVGSRPQISPGQHPKKSSSQQTYTQSDVGQPWYILQDSLPKYSHLSALRYPPIAF
jgi:hypothetical protein